MSKPMIMFISSSAAVKKMMGTLETCRTFLQNSNPVPSGRDTSSTSKSYFPSSHKLSASLRVLATTNSNPCFLNAKESPLIRLKSSSRSNILLMLLLLSLFCPAIKRLLRSFRNQPNTGHFYSAGDTPTSTIIIYPTRCHAPLFGSLFQCHIVHFAPPQSTL